MSKQDGLTFGVAGLLAWAAATAYYAAFGGALLERAFWFYAVNAFGVGAAACFLYQAALKLSGAPRRRRPLAALVFALPGLVGGGLTLAFLTDLFPQLQPVSVGRYGAFLFVGYAMIAAVAFEPKLKTASSPAR